MFGGKGANRLDGTATNSVQPKLSDNGAGRASKPQCIKRSSVESLPDVKRKVPSTRKKSGEFSPLGLRKVVLFIPQKVRLLFTGSQGKTADSPQYGGAVQQDGSAGKKTGVSGRVGTANWHSSWTAEDQALQNRFNKLREREASTGKRANISTGKAVKPNWTPEDQALANRLKKLKGQVAHDTIQPSGNRKNYSQLRDQLHNITSIDDLKAVVADRRSSRITPQQQQNYLGLLNAAVRGMAKNPQYAEKMDADLIRDLLDKQPGEANDAIALMEKTLVDNLQRRLDQLRRK